MPGAGTRLLCAVLCVVLTLLGCPRGACAGLPPLYVPDVLGAKEARAWLQQHHREAQRRQGSEAAWPGAMGLPDCNVTWAEAAAAVAEQQQQQRRHLVLATVGDSWGVDALRNKWLDDPRAAALFDVVVVYYGSNASWSCPQCLHTFRNSGPKWQMLHATLFSPEWEELAAGHDWGYVWMPDDDIVASACEISRFFALLEEQQLYLAQMSVCRAEGSSVLWPHLHQRPGNALRYVAFVEIMAAAVRFDFFQAVVRTTLGRSWTGWGLDSIWPFYLGFPQDGMAVVDAVCMLHSGVAGAGKKAEGASNYAAAMGSSPYDNPYHEDDAVKAFWRVTPEAIITMGVPPDTGTRGVMEFHSVPLWQLLPQVKLSIPSVGLGTSATSLPADASLLAPAQVVLPITDTPTEGLPQAALPVPGRASRRMPAQAAAAVSGAGFEGGVGTAAAPAIVCAIMALATTLAAAMVVRRRRHMGAAHSRAGAPNGRAHGAATMA